MPKSGVYSRVSRITILFVDDDADTRFAYQAAAGAEGFDVVLASGGWEALTLASEVAPDVIVLDAHLPDIHGFEVARRLRSSPGTCAIPIIVVSGEDGPRFTAAARDSGCNGQLTKPCSIDDLFRLVSDLASGIRENAVEHSAA